MFVFVCKALCKAGSGKCCFHKAYYYDNKQHLMCIQPQRMWALGTNRSWKVTTKVGLSAFIATPAAAACSSLLKGGRSFPQTSVLVMTATCGCTSCSNVHMTPTFLAKTYLSGDITAAESVCFRCWWCCLEKKAPLCISCIQLVSSVSVNCSHTLESFVLTSTSTIMSTHCSPNYFHLLPQSCSVLHSHICVPWDADE